MQKRTRQSANWRIFRLTFRSVGILELKIISHDLIIFVLKQLLAFLSKLCNFKIVLDMRKCILGTTRRDVALVSRVFNMKTMKTLVWEISIWVGEIGIFHFIIVFIRWTKFQWTSYRQCDQMALANIQMSTF